MIADEADLVFARLSPEFDAAVAEIARRGLSGELLGKHLRYLYAMWNLTCGIHHPTIDLPASGLPNVRRDLLPGLVAALAEFYGVEDPSVRA